MIAVNPESLASSPPSSFSARPRSDSIETIQSTQSAEAFVPPNSRRGGRNFRIRANTDTTAGSIPATNPSSVSLPEHRSSIPAPVQEAPPLPPGALQLLRTRPSTTSLALSNTSSTSTTRRIPAPPPPTPHFMFQTQTSRPRRPKTADSSAAGSFASTSSRGSGFKRFLSGFRMAPVNESRQSFASASSTSLEAEGTRRPLGAVESAKQQGKRAIAFVKRKLNSQTPKEELPKTWEEYGQLYAANQIDIDDPPLPPNPIAAEGQEPTPFQKRVYVAPRPPNEEQRLNVINRLDLFGTRAKKEAAESKAMLSITTHLSSVERAPSASAASASTNSLVPLSEPASSLLKSPGSSLLRCDSSSGTSTSSDTSSPVTEEDSLANHPLFRSIVSRCRELFKAKVSMLSILDEGEQKFLAAGGMPDGVDSLPRDVTFCTHAILDEDRGLVVLNSQQDWRFANNVPSTALGARFYAGVPLLARTHGTPGAPSVAIGVLCVADDHPRTEFTDAHRRVLRDLAMQASNAIEAWVSQRMAAKLARLHGSFTSGSLPHLPKLSLRPPPGLASLSASPPSTPTLPAARSPLSPSPSPALSPAPSPARRPKTAPAPPAGALPATPPASVHRFGSLHSRADSDTDSTASSSAASSALRRPSTANSSVALSLGVTTDDPVSSVPRELQKVFDTATKMLSKALELNLVYLAALELSVPAPKGPTLRILSSCGLPHPAPSFDPALHLKALRAPEGGLIYKNPRFQPDDLERGSGSYASGILIPVLEVRRIGYVLCGYTSRSQREFVQRDLTYMVRFAEQLEGSVTRLGRSDQLLRPTF
ncbi:hypothetical protein JCM21900_001459 [Sporobolomyces salmonicolor]